MTMLRSDAARRAAREDGGTLVVHTWSERDGLLRTTDGEGLRAIEAAIADPSVRVWADLEDVPHATLAQVAGLLGIHELVIEDMTKRNQRAKIEHTDGTMHIVLYALSYERRLHAWEVDLVVGPRFLLSSHPPEWRPIETVEMDRRGVEHYLSSGIDYLLYAIVDPLVDGYFPVMDRFSDEIDRIEDEVVRDPRKPVLERLFRVRRELLRIRHTVSPEREILNQLTNRENPIIAPERVIYFRDIYDHLIRITDDLDTHRELVSGALEAYLSTINNGLSEVMKKLTAVTAVLAGAGAVAGIFGMSEAGAALDLREGLGFWIVAGLVLAVGSGVFAYFRKIGWI